VRRNGGAWVLLLASLAAWGWAWGASFRERLPQDEVVYFLLPDRFENGDPGNDRGGLTGSRLVTGFDPTDAGFYHGGDLKGLKSRLDYIQSLGATAVWIGPVYKNKPVQGGPGQESAGYHGYWVTDFTHVDPHLGTDEDLRGVVEAAHARGLKVYLDIITNHTADVIAYRECPRSACPYRSRAEYPYTRQGGLGGEPINEGFLGDEATYQTAENFSKLTRPDYAYTPFVPQGQEHLKVPDWLNDPIYYHNRGNTTFEGESLTLGDFGGLDDLMTENPRVVRGFIDIYGSWIDRFGVDGFRIDTARHVNPEFWQQFVPAMLERARAAGIPHFHIFGEVSTTTVDPATLALHTRVDRLPAVLDFAFAAAVRETVAGHAGTDVLARLFAQDALYEGGERAALELPTFVSNHDAGRFASFVRAAQPGIADEETLQRVILAHAMLLTLRGVPVVYYGDEQGFVGTGGDRAARQDMFATRVPSYNADHVLGGGESGAHFNTGHPLYRVIAELARLRREHPALRRGRQVVRSAGGAPGLFVVSRLGPGAAEGALAGGRGGWSDSEIVVAFNTSEQVMSGQITTEPGSNHFVSLHGNCADQASAPGSYRVEVQPLDFVVCEAVTGP
jgi:glycosidase